MEWFFKIRPFPFDSFVSDGISCSEMNELRQETKTFKNALHVGLNFRELIFV